MPQTLNKRFPGMRSQTHLVQPIQRILTEVRCQADEAWWNGDEQRGRRLDQQVKKLQQHIDNGELYVPRF